MFMRFGKILALLAVMASAVNAQCALSCSLHATGLPDDSRSALVDSPQTGHSCGHGQNTPEPNKPVECRQPCPDSFPAISASAAPAPLHADVRPQWLEVPRLWSFDVSIRNQPERTVFAADSASPPDISAFFILRV